MPSSAAIAVPSEVSQAAARNAYPAAHVTGDYRELCAREDITVVDAVLPTFLHREVSLEALKAGKHLLLEKPMGATLSECREILEAARASERGARGGARVSSFVAVGHNQGDHRPRRDRGAAVRPGRALTTTLSLRRRRMALRHWPRRQLDSRGADPLLRPRALVSLRCRVACRGLRDGQREDPARPELQDNFSSILRWSNGSYAVVSQTLGAFEHHQTVKVSGNQRLGLGRMERCCGPTERPSFFLRLQAGRDAEPRDVSLGLPSGEFFELRAEIRHLVEAVQGEVPPAATGEDGLWSVGLCLAAQESVESGRPVDIGAFLRP